MAIKKTKSYSESFCKEEAVKMADLLDRKATDILRLLRTQIEHK